jgi:hypothetical protein
MDRGAGESPLATLAVPAVLAGVLLTPLGLFMGLYRMAADLTLPRVGTLTDPVRALKGFFKAVRHGRLGAAYQCLAPGERNRWPRRHPPLDLPGMKLGGAFDFSTPEGFVRYWRPLGVSSWMAGRSVKFGRWELLREEGDFALVACQVNFSSSSLSPLVAMLCLVTLVVGFVFIPGHKTGRAQVKAVKLLRRVDGHWYVVCGEMLGPEDDPEALAEALRLARAGSGELAALAGQLAGVVA